MKLEILNKEETLKGMLPNSCLLQQTGFVGG
jgi:hypothetical protein